MSTLRLVVIDVGWGDSLLIESEEGGTRAFALVDSNDTSISRSSALFLRRYFQKLNIDIDTAKPLFEFVLLSHGHADHAQGLKASIREFGTKQLYYASNATPRAAVANLLSYARRTGIPATQIFQGFPIASLKSVSFEVLWPPKGCTEAMENNHSVVLQATLAGSTFILTGDAEATVWGTIAPNLPASTTMFKVPHHGSENGVFDTAGMTPWLTKLAHCACLSISSHVVPYKHPDARVITEFDTAGEVYYRTDEQYHLEFETSGVGCTVKFSH